MYVTLSDKTVYEYGPSSRAPRSHIVCRTQARVPRAPSITMTVWPGDFVEIKVPEDLPQDATLALKPGMESAASLQTHGRNLDL